MLADRERNGRGWKGFEGLGKRGIRVVEAETEGSAGPSRLTPRSLTPWGNTRGRNLDIREVCATAAEGLVVS
jgi:hypothetical protein